MQKHTKVLIAFGVGFAVVATVIGVWIATHQAWVGEQPDTADYFHKTIGLITDLPHSTVEIFWSAVENVLTFVILWTISERRLHRKIDAEHGYVHESDGTIHKVGH